MENTVGNTEKEDWNMAKNGYNKTMRVNERARILSDKLRLEAFKN